MINKICDLAAAFADVKDGSTVLLGGFGSSGQPRQLIDALIETGVRDLTVVANNAGVGRDGFARLLESGNVRKIICSFPRSSDSSVIEALHKSKSIEIEVVPQGVIADRIRAAASDIPAFFTPTGVGTFVAQGKEARTFNGKEYLLVEAIYADIALVEAWRADRWGNLVYRTAGRNFNPIMAMAARKTIVQSQHIVELGELDPETIVTPGVFVDHVIHIPYGEPSGF